MWAPIRRMEDGRRAHCTITRQIADGEKIKAEARTGRQDTVGSSWCPPSICMMDKRRQLCKADSCTIMSLLCSCILPQELDRGKMLFKTSETLFNSINKTPVYEVTDGKRNAFLFSWKLPKCRPDETTKEKITVPHIATCFIRNLNFCICNASKATAGDKNVPLVGNEASNGH